MSTRTLIGVCGILALGLLCVCVGVRGQPSMKAKITPIDGQNWDSFVLNPKKHVLVMFTENEKEWCVACKEATPTYSAVAKAFKHEPTVSLGTVDVAAAPEFGEKYNVDAYPTIYFFPKDNKEQPLKYKGPNDAKELFNFVNAVAKTRANAPTGGSKTRGAMKTNKSPVITLTDTTFDAGLKKAGSLLVMFSSPTCGYCKRAYPVFEKVALDFQKEKIALAKVDATANGKLAFNYKIQAYPTFWFVQANGAKEEYKEQANQRPFVLYLNKKLGSKVEPPAPTEEERLAELPSNVTALTDANFEAIANDQNKHVFVEFYAPWCGHCKQLAPIWENLALAYKEHDDVVIAKIDADSQRGAMDKYEVKGFPTLKFFPKGGQVEDYSGGRGLAALVGFLNDKTGYEVEFGEEEQQDPNSHVYVLSDRSFNKIVNDPSKDVLVEYYAPWCGHCKAIEPTFNELAQHFSSNDDVIIAKVDATKHTLAAEAGKVQGFPTIKLYSKDNKTGIDYNGQRTLADMVNFVENKGQGVEPPAGEEF